MILELKTYQRGALEAFTRWLDALEEARNTSETAIATLEQAGIDNIPEDLRNYPKTAWQKLAANGGDCRECR